MINWRVYAVSGAAVLAAVWAFTAWHSNKHYRAGYESAKSEYTIKLNAINEENRKHEIKLQESADAWEAKHNDLVTASVNSAIALDDTVSSLRDQLDAANREAEYEATRAGRAMDENARLTIELRNVVALCADEYSRMAKEAESLRVNLIGLQGWAKIVLSK